VCDVLFLPRGYRLYSKTFTAGAFSPYFAFFYLGATAFTLKRLPQALFFSDFTFFT
jgi:hypothetical protein